MLLLQYAMVSHEPVFVAVLPRSSTRIQVPLGVAALHEGTSVRVGKAVVTHGDCHVP